MSLLSGKDDEKIFVFSEMEVKEKKNANKRINRNFICGKVAVGSEMKDYSNIIDSDKLQAMNSQYPDTKIVYRGKLSATKYNGIDESFIVR